jgi:hypothetical protein
VKFKYKIQDEKMYNLDDCRHEMRPIQRGVLYVSASTRRHPNQCRGNRKWVVVLHAFNATDSGYHLTDNLGHDVSCKSNERCADRDQSNDSACKEFDKTEIATHDPTKVPCNSTHRVACSEGGEQTRKKAWNPPHYTYHPIKMAAIEHQQILC